MRTNIFKYPVSFALIICAVFNLQAQPFTSKAYKTGNYISNKQAGTPQYSDAHLAAATEIRAQQAADREKHKNVR